ncbi:MAG: hypothetical protein GQ529_05485, partial [Methyloprofundus sp.]|nr:hypothetical protein [Methyloprofundus sp.]
MDKIILALVMFMLAMYAKRKIEKKATDTLEKELKKVSLSSPPQILAKDIEK